LVDPVFIHPCEQGKFSKLGDEGVNCGTGIGRDDGDVWEAVGGVGAGNGVVLPRKIAVLGIAAVTEVRPQTMECPLVGWKQLSLALKTGVGVPELGAQEETAICFDAAAIEELGGIGSVGLGAA
jgi:hypothetical protein